MRRGQASGSRLGSSQLDRQRRVNWLPDAAGLHICHSSSRLSLGAMQRQRRRSPVTCSRGRAAAGCLSRDKFVSSPYSHSVELDPAEPLDNHATGNSAADDNFDLCPARARDKWFASRCIANKRAAGTSTCKYGESPLAGRIQLVIGSLIHNSDGRGNNTIIAWLLLLLL